MDSTTSTETALTAEQAVAYLIDRHSIDLAARTLEQRARAGTAPSHLVGRNRMYRASLLDQWALGEWEADS